MGAYTSQTTGLLAVKQALTVVDLTTLQPFVEVESTGTQQATQALRLLAKRPAVARLQLLRSTTQLVTLCLESGNYLRFQPDTGSQCNVIPVHLNKKAANDPDVKQLKPTHSAISAYGGSKLPVVGQVTPRVLRDSVTYRVDCKLVDSKDIRPILG